MTDYVEGMGELDDISNYAGNDHPDVDELNENVKRLEALLRNRQELIDALSVIERNTGEPAARITATEAIYKAKELDND